MYILEVFALYQKMLRYLLTYILRLFFAREPSINRLIKERHLLHLGPPSQTSFVAQNNPGTVVAERIIRVLMFFCLKHPIRVKLPHSSTSLCRCVLDLILPAR